MLILDNVDEIIASDEKSFYALLKSILERRKKVENSPDHVYGMVRYFDILKFYFDNFKMIVLYDCKTLVL